MAAKGILERLSEGVVLGDGGYIIELEQRGYVVTGAFTPELAITHPVDGEGPRRQLHWRLLRVQGDPHARDGQGTG